MTLGSGRHQAVLEELTEWWEDVRDGSIGSRVVLLEVPPGWGTRAVLDAFREVAKDPDGPVTISVSVDDVPLVGGAIEAGALRDALITPSVWSKTAELLGLDSAAGEVQLALGVGGLFASGMAMAASMLLASIAVTAAGNAWDASPAGQQGALARAARSVAAVSVAAPVLVVLDEADRLDQNLALTMISNLVERYDGQVLVVVVVRPNSPLAAALSAPDRYELLGRVQKADADPDMGEAARAEVAREMCPWLAGAAVERIARRTRTFAEVLAVASAGRLADLAGDEEPMTLAVVDAVINACMPRPEVTAQAKALGWAGGTLTIRQAERAVQVLASSSQSLGSAEADDDPWVVRSGGLARLADSASPRVAESVAALSNAVRQQLAAVVLEEAIGIAHDPEASLTDRVIARLAAHRVRADLARRDQLTGVQCLLIRGLERFGDQAAARKVAVAALAELPDGDPLGKEQADLLQAALRLTRPGQDEDPVIRQAVDLALANGAILSLEARVWAAVSLLVRPGQREAALVLADQVTTELDGIPFMDATANQWRILLAFHVGRVGYPALSHRLLAPVISSGAAAQQQAAQAVLRAIDGPRADTRLQIIILEAELAATPPAAEDDLLRLHRTLAHDYNGLGDYRSALQHGADQLRLSILLLGPDHPQTLDARSWCALWTGRSGSPAEALRLSRELLPDQVRVLGRDHPEVLTTRSNIAAWTGECGDPAEALRLSRELLPDQVRVLGRDHPEVLVTRNNIAAGTGMCGDPAGALRLFRELLPDRVRVLGRDHPEVLVTRSNIAFWTGRCGDPAGALRLFRELLPDRVRVLGRDHPEVLVTRSNIAFWTGRCGDSAGALRLFRELLPDMIRVLGPDHPNVLTARGNMTALAE